MRDRSSFRRSARLERGAAAVASVLCVLACGSGEHTQVPPSVDADAGTSISSAVNVCPYFEDSLILPQRIPPRESALVAVRATDPDAADSLLAFRWSATSGTFSVSDKPVTNYSCLKLGAAQLTVTVTDRQGCSSDLTIGVQCVAK
jgi:hypothetical protein